MDESHGTYIGQQLKNSQYRKRNNRRMSSIMSQIRMSQQQEEEESCGRNRNEDRIRELDFITREFRGENRTGRRKGLRFGLKRLSGFGEGTTKIASPKMMLSSRGLDDEKENIKEAKPKIASTFRQLQCSTLSSGQKFRITIKQGPLKVPKLTCFSNQLTLRYSRSSTSTPGNPFPSLALAHAPQMSAQKFQQRPNLGQQNIHRLNSFIRGAYENQINQFSTVVNLNLIDRYRRDFHIYEKIYNDMVENNLENKRTLRDAKDQTFEDVVLLNELKSHATAPEFLSTLEELKIIK